MCVCDVSKFLCRKVTKYKCITFMSIVVKADVCFFFGGGGGVELVRHFIKDKDKKSTIRSVVLL